MSDGHVLPDDVLPEGRIEYDAHYFVSPGCVYLGQTIRFRRQEIHVMFEGIGAEPLVIWRPGRRGRCGDCGERATELVNGFCRSCFESIKVLAATHERPRPRQANQEVLL